MLTSLMPMVEAKGTDFVAKDDSWKKLTLREKIGQIMIIRAFRDDQVRQFGSIAKMMERYPVGGIFVPPWDFLPKPPRENVIPNIKKAISEYEQVARFPMIVTEDFERGVGSVYYEYTNLPSEMALGAANKPNLAFQFGNAIAKEASNLGINWLLHPLADLNVNPLQDLIVERAIGDDANHAYPLIKAQCDGIKAQGVVPTLKHFPGDGVTIKNQHLVTSTNYLDKKEWYATFGSLYQKLINDGAPCIMVGHIRLPAFQTKKLKGVFPPATMSEEIMVDLLKNKMKFNGVIMSDALNMGGSAGYFKNELESAVEAFRSGVDLVLWPNLEFLDTIEVRIQRGEIPMTRLDDAVQRIWGVREKYGLLKKKGNIFYPLNEADVKKIKQTGADVAESAITLISDPKYIPVSPSNGKKLAIISIGHNDRLPELAYTKQLLEARGFSVDTMLHNPSFFDWGFRLDYFDRFDRIIIAMENRYFSPLGTSLLKDKEVMGVWTLGMLPEEKLVAISYSNPYYVNLYFENAPIKINAYSIDHFSQKAVVDALTGVIPFRGKSPVKLNHKVLE
jgi:beta-N-acetylhexosaminidase